VMADSRDSIRSPTKTRASKHRAPSQLRAGTVPHSTGKKLSLGGVAESLFRLQKDMDAVVPKVQRGGFGQVAIFDLDGELMPADILRFDQSSGQTLFLRSPGTGATDLRILAGSSARAALILENDAQGWELRCRTDDLFTIYDKTAATHPFHIKTGATEATLVLESNGSISIFSTIDGRDLAVDGTKLDGIESGATGDQTDAEIETAYNNQVSVVSQAEAEAGTSTTARRWTAERVKQAIAALETSGSLANIVEDLSPQLGGHLDVNGQVIGDGTRELLTFVEDGSAVNHLEIENQATGAGPILRSTGDNTNVDLHLATKGSGNIKADDDLDVTGAITVTSTVDGRDVAADGTKLDGIETAATADQSNVEIKTAYEANADTNAFDDAEQTKLAGIESAATADQSNVEIKTAYEANADTNAFDDAEQTKLAGIEASADVTDFVNVDAALDGNVITNFESVGIDDDATSTAITITAAELVGIGKVGPAQMLDVAGDARIGSAVAATGAFLEIGANSSGSRFAFIDLVGDDTFTDYGLRLVRGATGANAISQLDHRGTGALLIRATDAGSVSIQTSAATRLTVDSAGLIAVGSHSPSTNLHIQESNTDTVPTLELEQLSTGDAGLQLTVAAKSYALAIDNSDSDKLKLTWTATAGAATAASANVMTFMGQTFPRVGIRATTPGAPLHVVETDSTAGTRVLDLEQQKISEAFVNYIGTSAADGSRSISSDTTEDASKAGAFRIRVNNTTRWVRFYVDES